VPNTPNNFYYHAQHHTSGGALHGVIGGSVQPLSLPMCIPVPAGNGSMPGAALPMAAPASAAAAAPAPTPALAHFPMRVLANAGAGVVHSGTHISRRPASSGPGISWGGGAVGNNNNINNKDAMTVPLNSTMASPMSSSDDPMMMGTEDVDDWMTHFANPNEPRDSDDAMLADLVAI
jgi:hypothetical protein